MKIKDIFYSVMQKDNNPFENPRIVKFKVEKIDNDSSYPIVSTKQDRWGRYYRFKENQIHLTYEDALVEKKQILEKIKKFEQERKEKNRLYFAEQEAREKQRQEEHDNKIREEERKKVVQDLKDWCDKNFNWVGDGTGYDGQDYNEMIGSNNTINQLREILDQIERNDV